MFSEKTGISSVAVSDLYLWPVKKFFALILLSILTLPAFAGIQLLRGMVVIAGTDSAMDQVQIVNIHNNKLSSTDSAGGFAVAGEGGQLLEFRSSGYETQRLRVPNGTLPAFFKVQLRPQMERLEKYASLSPAQRDSINIRDAFTRALAMPKLKGYQVVQSPFSALSKRNRQLWAFQEDFEYSEQQKYIDRVFNPELIAKITGIAPDSIRLYTKTFRPRYEQLLAMKEIEFYSYIRQTGEAWQRRENARRVGNRISN